MIKFILNQRKNLPISRGRFSTSGSNICTRKDALHLKSLARPHMSTPVRQLESGSVRLFLLFVRICDFCRSRDAASAWRLHILATIYSTFHDDFSKDGRPLFTRVSLKARPRSTVTN